MLREIVDFLITPMVNKVSVWAAKNGGATLSFCHDTKFYVPDKHREMVKLAMDDVVSFFGKDWSQYRGLIRQVVIVDGLVTRVVLAHGFLMINGSDRSRLASPVHFAGWIIAYFRMMKVYRDNCLWRFPNRKAEHLAMEEGTTIRKKYLQKQNLPEGSARRKGHRKGQPGICSIF